MASFAEARTTTYPPTTDGTPSDVTRQQEAPQPPRALPAWHDGVWYRSRTEGRWAVFFDALRESGLDCMFEWEPQGFVTDGTAYLPDFLLANQRLICEVKASLTADPNGVARWTALIEARQKERGVLLTDMNAGTREFLLIGPDGEGGHWEDDRSTWLVCPGGHHLDIHPYPPAGCPRCPHGDGYWYEDDRITKAFDHARSYRFGR